MSESAFRKILVVVSFLWVLLVLLPSVLDTGGRLVAMARDVLPVGGPELLVSVLEDDGKTPVGGALVQVSGGWRGVSAEDGQVAFATLPVGGSVSIRVQKQDYRLADLPEVAVRSRGRTRVAIRLQREPGQRLFVAYDPAFGGRGISVIDAASHLVLDSQGDAAVWGGLLVRGLLVNPQYKHLYAFTVDRMIVVDVPSGWTVTSVPLPGTPVSYAISPDGRTFFLCTSEVAAPTAPCRLRLLDTETWQVRAVMTLSGAWTPPITLMPHPNGSDLLISSPAMDRVLVYTGQGRLLRFQRSIQLLDKPLTIALSPDGRFLFYVGAQDRSLYSWQADNVQKRVGPTGLANSIDQPGSLTVILRDGKPYVYMTVPSMGTVIVVDGSSGQAETIAVGQRPMAVVATADGRTVFVANYLTNTVVVIDAEKNTVQDTIPVRLRPYLLVTL